MIKGIIGFKVLNYKDLEPVLMQLRSHAMQYPGYIGAENLVSEDNFSVVVMISTWEKMDNWRTWVESRVTRDLLRQARAVVTGVARITGLQDNAPSRVVLIRHQSLLIAAP